MGQPAVIYNLADKNELPVFRIDANCAATINLAG
jgi:hypothetical protein